ncbi:MAG: hypothetical protein ACRDRG_15575 [Pseudonocardiaceae bacterium]
MTPLPSDDYLPGVGIYVERYELPAGTRFDTHWHHEPQIVWSGTGSVAVEVSDRT